MKYKAKYVEQAAIEAAQEVAQEWIRSDGYYAMYGGGGTGLVHRNAHDGIWDSAYVIDSFGPVGVGDLSQVILPDQWFSEVCKVSWRTCRDNYASVEFLHEHEYSPRHITAVVVHMDGVRHGIPAAIYEMAKFEPDAVVYYESWRTDVSPFAVGLDPTPPTMKGEDVGESPSRIVTGGVFRCCLESIPEQFKRGMGREAGEAETYKRWRNS